MDLSKISIGIRTFLRDPQLYNTIKAIRKTLPECKMIIADCGEMTEEKDGIYADLSREGHLCFTLPFDSGFGQMSNTIASAVTTSYLLIGSDDFDFNPPDVRQGIERLCWTLDNRPDLDIVSGRVDNRPYEFRLFFDGDGVFREDPVNPVDEITECYLTVNYSLIRRQVFNTVKWDSDVKIGGGEHFAFFHDVFISGWSVAYVKGVNINQQRFENTGRYRQFRNRARSPERPCFVKRGVKKYVLGCGTVDYDETVNSHQEL